jgi:hypothetical protein
MRETKEEEIKWNKSQVSTMYTTFLKANQDKEVVVNRNSGCIGFTKQRACGQTEVT